MQRVIFSLVLFSACAAAQMREDTARLLTHLGQFRVPNYEIRAADYGAIRVEHLNWIDSRLRAHFSVARMNEELGDAGLLQESQFDYARAGFLEEVVDQAVAGTDDLSAVKFGAYLGGNCYVDETVVLYKRGSGERVATINAEKDYTHGYILRALDAGHDSSDGGRIVGSEWVASSCASNWNGNIFRIDRSTTGSTTNILRENLWAFLDGDMDVKVAGETVTIRYQTRITYPEFDIRSAVKRYQVQGTHAVREGPIANSFGGFIDEWLTMGDAEAARWSSLEAANLHHAVRAVLDQKDHQPLGWVSAAQCSDFPAIREIEMAYDSEASVVFRIAGSKPDEMRMIAVSPETSDDCRDLDLDGSLSPIMDEPAH